MECERYIAGNGIFEYWLKGRKMSKKENEYPYGFISKFTKEFSRSSPSRYGEIASVGFSFNFLSHCCNVKIIIIMIIIVKLPILSKA